MRKEILAFYILFLIIFSNFLFSEDAYDIIKKADDNMRGMTQYAEMQLSIVKPDWQRDISLKSWSKDTTYSIILITGPARDKGMSFLKRDKEVWQWIPSIERIIKIPPSMMMQSWMGSDFTNDDLVKESSIVNDYVQTIVGDSVIDGYDCYKIKLIPKPDAVVVWGKVLIWISKKDYIELLIEYYDEDNELINIMRCSKIKKIDDRTISTYLEMIPVTKPGQKTIIEYNSIKFNIPIKDSFFSQQHMKRLR